VKKPIIVVPKCPLSKLDLRSITRHTDRCRTCVTLYWDWDTRFEWIICGEVGIRQHEGHHDFYGGTSQLTSYLDKGATDFSHDSAYARSLPLIGLTMDSIHYHQTRLHAWINPNEDITDGGSSEFRVPEPGYDPTKLEGAFECEDEHCEKKHIIVPEGFYFPPHNAKMYDLVKGKKIEIMIGPVFPKEDE
jgi:hypothetical protein